MWEWIVIGGVWAARELWGWFSRRSSRRTEAVVSLAGDFVVDIARELDRADLLPERADAILHKALELVDQAADKAGVDLGRCRAEAEAAAQKKVNELALASIPGALADIDDAAARVARTLEDGTARLERAFGPSTFVPWRFPGRR